MITTALKWLFDRIPSENVPSAVPAHLHDAEAAHSVWDISVSSLRGAGELSKLLTKVGG